MNNGMNIHKKRGTKSKDMAWEREEEEILRQLEEEGDGGFYNDETYDLEDDISLEDLEMEYE